ncbi:MAG: WxcM-like domain-containing protein [Kiritimatiellae bacterium]|nr:WxcM-like domain-containing protein [Kiritimatiellia bacterium]
MKPELIQGGSHSDVRGLLRFCNDFDMSIVKRFYTISNSAEQPVRGWIGHKKETKWFFPLRGRTVIEVESFNRVDRVERVEMDAERPCVSKVPPGNWFKIVQDGNAEVMVFSDCKVGEFENDDFRREL